MPHNHNYTRRRKLNLRALKYQTAILEGRQNILAGLLARGFFGRMKWLLIGR